ncbi:MAG: helix-turn-helix domain-containing protein [Solirubrobacteraceae bacterium]
MPASRKKPPITNLEDPRYVKALAHPLRIRILALLEERDASPVLLAEHLDATLGTVAYHVRTLEKLGLIEMVATHQRRGATEHVYAAREHPRFSDSAWSATSPLAKHVMIASILSQIGQYVTQSAAGGGFDRSDAHFTRTALKLDREGWSELAAAARTWLEQAQAIEAQTAKRLKRSGEQAIDAGLVLLFFEALPFFEAPAPAKPAAERSSARRPRRTD